MSDEGEKKEPEAQFIDNDQITEADKHRPVTMAEFKRWRKRTVGDIEKILQDQQKTSSPVRRS